jgi:hypothetical protein
MSVPSIDFMNLWVWIENFILIYSPCHKSKYVVRGKWQYAKSYILNKPLHTHLWAPLIIVIIFFCSRKMLLLLVELTQKIIPYDMIEWKYVKYTIFKSSTLSRNKSDLTASMLNFIFVLSGPCNFYILIDCQFGDQGTWAVIASWTDRSQ